MKYTIKAVNYGIANRFPGYYIEYHKKLDQPAYKKLKKEIIEHEKKHSDKGYDIEDLINDFVGFFEKKLYYKFILTTPSSWIQYFPLYRSRNKWYIDPMLTLIYIITGGIFITIWFLIDFYT